MAENCEKELLTSGGKNNKVRFMSEQNIIQLPVPADEDLGPAMRSLNDRQKRFVIAWFHHGGNASRAAVTAGYTNANRETAGFQAFHNPKVQAAIAEYAQAVMKGEQLVLSIAAISEMLKDSAVEAGVRAKLALAIYDRVGLHATTEHKMTVEHVDDRAGKVARLMELAKTLGQDPRKLLGAAADVTDADYEIIDGTQGREGLEDLL